MCCRNRKSKSIIAFYVSQVISQCHWEIEYRYLLACSLFLFYVCVFMRSLPIERSFSSSFRIFLILIPFCRTDFKCGYRNLNGIRIMSCLYRIHIFCHCLFVVCWKHQIHKPYKYTDAHAHSFGIYVNIYPFIPQTSAS